MSGLVWSGPFCINTECQCPQRQCQQQQKSPTLTDCLLHINQNQTFDPVLASPLDTYLPVGLANIATNNPNHVSGPDQLDMVILFYSIYPGRVY